MAKKVRRIRRAKRNQETAAAPAETKPKLTAAEQFELEYSYGLKDLRQILLLALVMFALLIALNLFLQ